MAAVEADAAGRPLSAETWQLLTRMLDAALAVVDVRGRSPRQNDGDEGRAIVVDDPELDPWAVAVGSGVALLGAPDWTELPAASVQAVAVRGDRAAAASGPRDISAGDLPRRRVDGAALPSDGRTRDLVPLRRRPARLPVHRCARARRRTVDRAPPRRHRHPRRPGDVLLSRRAGLAAPGSVRRPLTTRSRSVASTRRSPAVRSCGRRPSTPPRWPRRSAIDPARSGLRSTTATAGSPPRLLIDGA